MANAIVVFLALSALIFFPQCMYAYPDSYEVLKEFGLPVGLLPKEVTGYKIDRCTGEFSVYLATERCNFSTDYYSLLRFKQTITGILSKERVSRIRGVKAKGLLWWSNIVEVLRISEGFVEITEAGGWKTTIPIENLLASPHCGCGFQCKNAPLSSPQCGCGFQSNNIPSSCGSVAIEVENKLAESNFSTHSTDPVSPPSGFPSQETPEPDVNFSKLAAQLEDISNILKEMNDRRLNITLLYDEVMKVRDFNESMLLRYFDYLVKNENAGNAFLVKTERHRTLSVQDFCLSDDEEEK